MKTKKMTANKIVAIAAMLAVIAFVVVIGIQVPAIMADTTTQQTAAIQNEHIEAKKLGEIKII